MLIFKAFYNDMKDKGYYYKNYEVFYSIVGKIKNYFGPEPIEARNINKS